MRLGKDKQHAFLMLAMMVLWIVLPVSACSRAVQQMSQHACCRAMGQACDSSAMSSNSSCCVVDRQNTGVAALAPESLEQSQNLTMMSPPIDFAILAASNLRHEMTSAPNPSVFCWSRNSILRI
jgi:hypothetical protein